MNKHDEAQLATPDDERVLRHMLGIDKPEKREPEAYRNRYAANPGDEHLARLAGMGLVELVRATGKPGIFGAYDRYRATDRGIEVARASHRRIRLPKSKRMYARFLDVSDCCPDLTFRDFLTSPRFEDVRRTA